MNCADAVVRLSAALDGELAADDAGDVRRHLDTCEACARRYRTLQQVRTAVRATSFAPVDAQRFDARVLERVHRDGRATRVSGPLMAAAAALVIAVSSAVLMLQERGGVTPRSAVESVAVPSALAEVPGLYEGRALLGMDCGLATGTCIVDAPPGLIAGN